MSLLRLVVAFVVLAGCFLSPALAEDKLRYAGATTLQRYFMPEITRLFSSDTGIYFEIEGGNTGPGIRALLDGKVDLAGAGRLLTDSEKAQGLVEHFLGWDVLSVVVHESNPVENLSRKQLQGIFSGEITNWKDVGGKETVIMVVNSPRGSGMRSAVQKLILGEKSFLKNEVVSAVVAQADSQVHLFPMAITALSKSMIDTPGVKLLKVDGVAASAATVASGDYPLAKPLALVTKGQPVDELGRFVEYALGSRGKMVLNKHFVALD